MFEQRLRNPEEETIDWTSINKYSKFVPYTCSTTYWKRKWKWGIFPKHIGKRKLIYCTVYLIRFSHENKWSFAETLAGHQNVDENWSWTPITHSLNNRPAKQVNVCVFPHLSCIEKLGMHVYKTYAMKWRNSMTRSITTLL